MAMPAEMTDDYHERSSIHAFRMVFVSLGSLIATAGV
jgi:GPH family glycoside/pentoside/hexuronide:cation symporter